MGPKEYEQAALRSLEAGGPASGMVYATLSVAARLKELRMVLEGIEDEVREEGWPESL